MNLGLDDARWPAARPLLDNPAAAALDRRSWLRLGAGLGFAVWLRPAAADAAELDAAIRSFTGGALPRPGKVGLDIPTLVDNGNAVPLSVRVDSPMTAADHVTAIAVFNELNPQREVIAATLGPGLGVARLSTRIRLATSQKLVAVARMNDGSHWSQTVDVIVTLAACIET